MRRQWIAMGFVALASVVALASPAFAQDKPGDVAVGLSILGDEGGVGFGAALSGKIKDLDKGKTLSWVGDVSFHHNSFPGGASWTFLLVGAGARVRGAINEKTDWFGQGLIGIRRLSGDFGSDTGLIVTPGGGIDYAFSPKMKARAQLDFPIGDGSTTRFFIGLVWDR